MNKIVSKRKKKSPKNYFIILGQRTFPLSYIFFLFFIIFNVILVNFWLQALTYGYEDNYFGFYIKSYECEMEKKK
jgi:hypothetical protein